MQGSRPRGFNAYLELERIWRCYVCDSGQEERISWRDWEAQPVCCIEVVGRIRLVPAIIAGLAVVIGVDGHEIGLGLRASGESDENCRKAETAEHVHDSRE